MSQSSIPQVIAETICLSDDSDVEMTDVKATKSENKPAVEERRTSRRKRTKVVNKRVYFSKESF